MQPDNVAGRREQVIQEDSSGCTIQIVVTGETRRQRKEIINRERLRAWGGAKSVMSKSVIARTKVIEPRDPRIRVLSSVVPQTSGESSRKR